MAHRTSNAGESNLTTTWTADKPPYVILKWSIQNFSAAQGTVKSLCFDVSRTSKWYLVLDPNVVEDGDAFVIFRLRRDPSCQNVAKLLLNGEFSVHGPLNDLLYDKLFEEVCLANRDIEFRMVKACLSTETSGDDTYLARCEMIVSEETSLNEWSPHLTELSGDFHRLYQASTLTDVTIQASDDTIVAHRTVLSARSSALKEMLNVGRVSENENNSLLVPLLLFLYTGDPELVLRSIPLELFGRVALIAEKWGLRELENILTPVRVLCQTRVKRVDFLYTWQLKNFSKLVRIARGRLCSSEFSTGGSQWRLILEKNSPPEPTSDRYGLYLEKIRSTDNFSKVDVEFRMYGRKSRFDVAKRKEFTFAPRNVQRFGFSPFSNHAYLESRVLRDDRLCVDCRLKFHLDPESLIRFEEKFLDVSENEPYSQKYLRSLARSFKSLYDSLEACDFQIVAEDGRVLSAHRAILCARSPYFSDLFSLSSQENDTLLPFDSDILKEVLSYMYSASLPPLNSRKCLKLCRACCFLKVAELFRTCREYLLRNLDVDTVLEVIVWAHECRDEELKNAAIRFASAQQNAKHILDTERWRNFRTHYVDLALLIYHNLAWAYCNHVSRT